MPKLGKRGILRGDLEINEVNFNVLCSSFVGMYHSKSKKEVTHNNFVTYSE